MVISDDAEVIGKLVANLERAVALVEDRRKALLRAVGEENFCQVFHEATSTEVMVALASYMDALITLKPLTDHQNGGNSNITLPRARAIYQDAVRRLARLKSQVQGITARKCPPVPPPQVGTHTSIHTVSGGLPTLGRRHR